MQSDGGVTRAHQPVSSKKCRFLAGAEEFIASDAGVAIGVHGWKSASSGIICWPVSYECFAHFAHTSDPYFCPPQCERLGVPADTDLHMYGRRLARAFINIYAFSLFRRRSVLGVTPYPGAFAIKSVARRLGGALIDNAPHSQKVFFFIPGSMALKHYSCRRVFLSRSIVVSFKAST